MKYLFFQVSYKELLHSVNSYNKQGVLRIYLVPVQVSYGKWKYGGGGVCELTIGAPVGELPS